MALLYWILLGAVAGWIAAVLTGSKNKGCVENIVVGMLGSLMGGFLLNLLMNGKANLTTAFTTFDFRSLIVSVIGAIVLIGLAGFIRK